MSGDEFEVEEILGRRTRNGRTKYKIRWRGFNESEDTWEPEENLTHCRTVIEDYIRDCDRDDALINQTLTDYPSMLNGSGIRSPLWSSTPAPNRGSPTATSPEGSRLRWDDSVIQRISPKKSSNRANSMPPEKVRLRWDDTVEEQMSPKRNMTNTNSTKDGSEIDVTSYLDEPVSRWPLMAFLLLLLGLAFYYTQWRQS